MEPGFAIALFGAVVATAVAVRQFTSERVRLKARIYPRPNRAAGFVAEYVNLGRRTVTIEWVGFIDPKDKEFWATELPLASGRILPTELSEGDAAECTHAVDLGRHRKLVIRDSVGRWWPRSRVPRARFRMWRYKRRD